MMVPLEFAKLRVLKGLVAAVYLIAAAFAAVEFCILLILFDWLHFAGRIVSKRIFIE